MDLPSLEVLGEGDKGDNGIVAIVIYIGNELLIVA